MNLKELDNLWEGQNIDKNSLKYLCRKYSPLLIIDWIHRGLSINKKEELKAYHKNKLSELGEVLIEKPKEVTDDRLFSEKYGDYFTEEN
jgi:hypothetical protein